jgi:hypothetical protein
MTKAHCCGSASIELLLCILAVSLDQFGVLTRIGYSEVANPVAVLAGKAQK